MRILVTGGCGFLGSNLAAYWLGAGEAVSVIDALYRSGSDVNLSWLESMAAPHQLRFHRQDVSDEAGVESIFCQDGPFDLVCHLAGQVAMTTSLEHPRLDMLTNVVGTFNVLEATRKRSPDALFVHSSTNKVYGDLEYLKRVETATRYVLPAHPDGLDENCALDFASPYGCSKGAADQYVRDWARNYGMNTVVFRHSSIFGGRQFATFDQGWVGWFCEKALEQEKVFKGGGRSTPFTISGSGKQVRDVLHSADLIRLYVRTYECRDKVAGEVFNIGGGMENSLSLLELFRLLEGDLRLGSEHELRYERLPRRRSDQDVFVADIKKARERLGWTPRVSAPEGVRLMLEWIRQRAL